MGPSTQEKVWNEVVLREQAMEEAMKTGGNFRDDFSVGIGYITRGSHHIYL